MDAASGTGLAFSYENDDDKTYFHMGADDDNTPCTVTQPDETHAVFTWEDGKQEKLTYLSADTADTFQFYTDEELCQMALRTYGELTGASTEWLETGAETNSDGTVTI